MGAPYSSENKHDRFPLSDVLPFAKEQTQLPERRLIKTGRQAGQTFGVRDLGHRGEKNHVTFHFHSRLTGTSSPFSDSICCSETLDSPSFSSQSHPFPRVLFPKPIQTVSWLSKGLTVSSFKHLNKMSR